MIHKLSLIFGSKTKAQEMILLLKDVKKVVRQGFYDQEMSGVERFCKENEIYFAKSKFKVLLADENSYTNKGIKVPETDHREGMHFVYFSKEEQKAWLASYYELMNNDKELGLLLGYPNCCVEFFCKRFSEDNPNLQLKSSNAWTNVNKRQQDVVMISHFPCSSECEESITLAKKYLETIQSIDNDRAIELLEQLKN
jgi:hypothetical protein